MHFIDESSMGLMRDTAQLQGTGMLDPFAAGLVHEARALRAPANQRMDGAAGGARVGQILVDPGPCPDRNGRRARHQVPPPSAAAPPSPRPVSLAFSAAIPALARTWGRSQPE